MVVTIFILCLVCIWLIYTVSKVNNENIELKEKLSFIATIKQKWDEVSTREENLSKKELKLNEELQAFESKKANLKNEVSEFKQKAKEEILEEKERIKQEYLAIKSSREGLKTIEDENLALREVIEDITNLWINDTFKSISNQLKFNNFSLLEGRLQKTFEKCTMKGIVFDGRQEQAFYTRLKSLWLKECEDQKAKEEQERIKDLIREEQRAEKLRAIEIKKIEDQEKIIKEKQKELEGKLKILKEIEELKSLTEAQKIELEELSNQNQALIEEYEEKERAKSMAEITKAGHIYVISNIGSFGENFFKIGMTRRLIPEDRIDELGDASVPFPFDIHMMISTENAPFLEGKIHEMLHESRINLVNERKEFFKTDLKTIKSIIDEICPNSKYHFTETAQAMQWRESESIRLKSFQERTKKAA